MKIILTPNDQAVAIQAYLVENYNIVTYIDEDNLQDMTIDVPPTWSDEPTKTTSSSKPKLRAPTPVDKERQEALDRADELGIEYHPNIGTDKLIKRIEEHEEEIASRAIESVQAMAEEPEVITQELDFTQEDLNKASQRTTGPLPDLEDKEDLFPVPNPVIPTKKSIFDRTP